MYSVYVIEKRMCIIDNLSNDNDDEEKLKSIELAKVDFVYHVDTTTCEKPATSRSLQMPSLKLL